MKFNVIKAKATGIPVKNRAMSNVTITTKIQSHSIANLHFEF